MKKQIIFLLALFSWVSHSQFDGIETMTFEQSQDINFFRSIKNNTKVKEYITISGNSVKVGDTLIIGKPTSSSSVSNTYASSYGSQYSASATTNTKNVKEFEFVQMGRPSGFGSVMSGLNGTGPAMAGISLSNEVVTVKEMKVYHKGSKKKPLNVVIVLGEINGRAFGINKYLSVMNTELAIESGELYLKNRKMTREEAIAKLKESKDLFDLDMMSEEEYKALRAELAPVIKGN